jgi:transposase
MCMPLAPDQLPDDIAELKRRLIATTAELSATTAELSATTAELSAAKNGLVITQLTIEKLKAQIARLKRVQFGASSERMDRAIEQLELALEEAEAAKAEAVAATTQPATEQPSISVEATAAATPEKKKRRRLPPELPRRDVVHLPPDICKRCGGTELSNVSESVTEVLSYVPGRFEVARHVRPACSCRKCETMMQAPMPALPIPRGMVDASFLAHIAVAKFCDHIPLYRQAGIYARSGLEIDRSQLAEWLGHVAWLLAPLVELIARHVMAGRAIHADDTPVPVLAPGAGKTKTGRLWVYLRDERPHAGIAPPAVLYRYTPDRKGEHCRKELANFTGWLHADGYSGFARLYEIAGARSADAILMQGPRALPRLPAGRMCGAASSTNGPSTSRRSPRKRWNTSVRCLTSSVRSPEPGPISGAPCASAQHAPGSTRWPPGSTRSSPKSPARATLPLPSVMHAHAGARSPAISMTAASSFQTMRRRTKSGQ